MNTTVRKIVCSQCVGKKLIQQWEPHHLAAEYVECPQCNGSGYIVVVVPANEAK